MNSRISFTVAKWVDDKTELNKININHEIEIFHSYFYNQNVLKRVG